MFRYIANYESKYTKMIYNLGWKEDISLIHIVSFFLYYKE
jgi:hypothetical protein